MTMALAWALFAHWISPSFFSSLSNHLPLGGLASHQMNVDILKSLPDLVNERLLLSTGILCSPPKYLIPRLSGFVFHGCETEAE